VYNFTVKSLSQLLAVALSFVLPASTMAGGLGGSTSSAAADACPARSLLLDFDVYRFGTHMGQAPIWRLGSGPAYYFKSGLLIDADGAPNAYNAENTGLDDLYNAGEPGRWDGIVQDEDGEPVVQGPDDPFPGYYISCTSLFDRTKHRGDPSRFVDATQVPYVALPHDLAAQTGTELGDLVFVFSEDTGRSAWAIFADIGAFGEGSIALAEDLGIRSDARRGGTPKGISYVVFPGSGDGQPKSVDQINLLADALMEAWSDAEKAFSCAGIGTEPAQATPTGESRAESPVTEQPTTKGD